MTARAAIDLAAPRRRRVRCRDVSSPPLPSVLVSPLLEARGVRHGFSTRNGGVSTGAFATLNAAAGPGDDPDAVRENLRLFSAAIDIDASRLYQIGQVHGSAVREVRPADDREALVREEGDALVARDPSIAIGIRVADCVPILLLDERSGHVAAVHAGWRGVVSSVISAALVALAEHAVRPAIVAAIGPCIGVCCFEVGRDVADLIEESAPGEPSIVQARPGAAPHVDLRLAVRRQLLALGVEPARIDDVPGCTHCDDARFFSYRRDGARSGRHIAAIAPSARG